MLQVLYEDNHIIAVFKPAGLLVQPAGPSDKGDLISEVRHYLKEKYNKPGNVFVGLVHRLDRNASGIVLLAKTSKGASRLSEQFRENKIKKIYHAVVEGNVSPEKAKLVHYLRKDEARKASVVSEEPKQGFEKAELSYEVVKESGNYSLVKINLKTGRFHQIRAQFSKKGNPVAGDVKYHSKTELPDKALYLCATEIEFETATTGEIQNIKIDYPAGWNHLIP